MTTPETIAGMTVAEAITRLRQVVAERGPLDGGEDDDKADNAELYPPRGCSKEQVLDYVVRRWRELKHPPSGDDLEHWRYVVRRRCGTLGKALAEASEMLTPEERKRYVRRCPYCGRVFASARSLSLHVNKCKKGGK